MYKRHKLLLLAVFVGSFFITFLLGLDFSPMAEAAITVASIAMGVYIAAVSALLGSDYAKNLKTTTDKEYPSKTLLGVLADYFRIAGLFCVVLIVAGCLYLILRYGMQLATLLLIYSDAVQRFLMPSFRLIFSFSG